MDVQPSRLKILWSFGRPHLPTLSFGLLLALIGSATGLASPMVTKWVLDSLADDASLSGPILALAALIASEWFARRAGLRFILNVVQDDEKRVVFVRAGEPEATFQELVAFAKTLYEVPVPQRYPIVIAGVGHPKDGNLYQASRAASYLFFAPTCLIRPGGYVLIPAPCGEGAGRGVGEQRFYRAMQQAPDVRSILEDARRNGYPPGQQRAFVLAKVLEQSHVIIVGSRCPEVVSACKMTPAATMEEALHIAGSAVGFSSDVLIVPHAMQTLPVVTTEHEEAGA